MPGETVGAVTHDRRATATVRVAVGLGLVVLPSVVLVWWIAGASGASATVGAGLVWVVFCAILLTHVVGRRRRPRPRT